MSFSLHLEAWRGWLAGESGYPQAAEHQISTQPGSTLPAMLRRRLDSAGRATCDILSALDPDASCPLIHASRHGDATHTLRMLEALAQAGPISPTRFSMSVHNAVLGVHSIASRHHRPLQALGACGHEFDALLYEATGYLVEGYPAVVVVFSEGPLPAAYQGRTECPESPCAVGMRLTLDSGRKLLSHNTSQPTRPTPIEVIAWLNADIPHLDGRQRWQLEAG